MNREIETKLRQCATLPTLSGVALRIVTIAQNPKAELTQVTKLLENDPALATKILRVANSSMYGRSRQAKTLPQAVTMLGLNATITLTLSFSLTGSMRENHDSKLDLDLYWRRALLSALAARLLGSYCHMRTLEELFLAGLLQDIGMCALDAALPERYAQVVSGIYEHDALIASERQVLDCDHREVSAWLMRDWGLPDYLAMSAVASHDPQAADVPTELRSFVDCVAVSAYVADIYLARDTDRATAKAAAAASTCLGMSSQTLDELLTDMASSVAEIEAFFEMPVLSTSQAMALTDQARELLVNHNLQLLHSTAQKRTQQDDFRKLADHLYDVARRDDLTGLFNRRYFNEVLADHFEQSKDDDRPLCVAYLDLDNFKAVNDEYGHLAGDDILVTTASHIQAQLRRDELLARYGGEEFVLLMPEIEARAAYRIVERIRAALADYEHQVETGETLRICVSAGIACHTPNPASEQTPHRLLHQADRALYQAKRQGRNQVVIAGDC